jgi:hypothetical protein
VQPTSSTTCPIAVARYTTRTRDPELAYQLISDTYGVLRPQISGSRERFRFSLTSVAVGSIASDGLTHSMNTPCLNRAAAASDSDVRGPRAHRGPRRPGD